MTTARRLILFLFGVGILLSAPAGAETRREVRVYGKALPSAEVLADTLFPRVRRTRSIVTLLDPELGHGAAGGAAPQAVSAPIRFAFDSAELLPQSLADLDKVGEMMGLEQAKGRRLRIEGHTDTQGSDPYNHGLSERRARAVADYLTRNHGVARDRLAMAGLGEERPLPGLAGDDPQNRRVEFHSVD